MFTVSVQTHFWASHSVAGPDGTKEPVHSHNFSVKAHLAAERLDKNGMVMDFCRLKQSLKSILGTLCGKQIGQIDYFKDNAESAEILAKYVFEQLKPLLPAQVTLQRVTVEEEPGCAASFHDSAGTG